MLDAWKRGARRVLGVSPTGSGKTTIFGSLTSAIKAPVLIVVHRVELATQAAKRLEEFDVEHGFIMPGEPSRPSRRVQVAMVQSLVRRAKPPAGLVILDEAHLSTAATWTKVLDCYPNAKILGLTATPWRLAGKPLIGAYDECIVIATPRELRELGYLCDYSGFSYKTPDLSAVATAAGDYNQEQSAEAMREPSIVDNVVEQYQAHASHLSAVVFAVTVEHSKQLTEKFIAAGISAEHLDGSTSSRERKAILARVESGETRVLSNVGVAVEGLDIPRLKCCVLARPTMSLARAIQMMGRVRRPWQGVSARIHDHAFTIKKHGLPDADRDYTLQAKEIELPELTQCEKCFAMYSGRQCTACGGENEVQVRGETTLATVPDAEQFTFTSQQVADEATWSAIDAKVKGPVKVAWTAIGRVVEGTLARRWEATNKFGQLTGNYLIKGEKREYAVPGTSMLDRLMKPVQISDSVRITYTGTQKVEGKIHAMKLFSVVRTGAPALDEEAVFAAIDGGS